MSSASTGIQTHGFIAKLGRTITIIRSLVIRESLTLFGAGIVGILKPFLPPTLLLFFFLLLRPLIFGRFTLETMQPVLLITGITMFFMFRSILARGLKLGKPTGPHFHFPFLKPYHLFASWGILYWNIFMLAMAALLLACFCIGVTFELTNWHYIVLGTTTLFVFSIGFGMVAWSLTVHFPFLLWPLHAFQRLFLWVSGVIIPVGSLPPSIQMYFAWNPVLNCIEMTRYGLGLNSSALFHDLSYCWLWSIALLAIGMLTSSHVERTCRK